LYTPLSEVNTHLSFAGVNEMGWLEKAVNTNAMNNRDFIKYGIHRYRIGEVEVFCDSSASANAHLSYKSPEIILMPIKIPSAEK
jgi:hypothetical protein